MTDRRVRRTREHLRRALIELVLEKGYQKVTVQDILDRADVGRSTFYAHYQSKDDLLLSGYEDLREEFLAEAEREPEVLGPIRALMQYVDQHRDLYQAMVFGRELAIRPVRDDLTDVLLDHLRPRLRVDETELGGVVAFLLTAMTGMITWWVRSRAPLTADELYQHYRRLAMPGLEPLLVLTQQSEI
jgi:AcrR family transcriptional regulator